MILKENLTTDLKNKMSSEFGKISGGGVEQMKVQNGFISSLGENKKKKKVKKTETKEVTGAGSAGGSEGVLFSTTKKEMEEMKETSFKAPKLTMFSDEAPKPLKTMNESCWKGYKQKGMKNKNGKQVPNCVPVKEEDEITKVETKEGTGASSAGSYVTPAAWSKSTKKKDWRGKSKTQIPGGKFVQVKKKCKKFPYCNQGDIKALNIFENETFKKVIKNISKKHGISENVIKSIVSYEYYNTK
jgi:hypothetical protein